MNFNLNIIKKSKNLPVHVFGALIIISVFYHSTSIFSLLVSIPVLLISYSVEQEIEWLSLLSLSMGTLYIPFFVSFGSMNEVLFFLAFLITFLLPLSIYWILVLSTEIDFEIGWKGLGFMISYPISIVLVFYLLSFSPRLADYLFSPEYKGPQAIILVGLGLLLIIPYNSFFDVKNYFKTS